MLVTALICPSKKGNEVEKTNIESRHAVALSVFTSAKEIAPHGYDWYFSWSASMLVRDPKSIGPAMAVGINWQCMVQQKCFMYSFNPKT